MIPVELTGSDRGHGRDSDRGNREPGRTNTRALNLLQRYQDDDFVLLPSPSWKKERRGFPSEAQGLTIVKDRELRSLRDLRGEDIPMLLSMREKATGAMAAEYVSPSFGY